MNKKTKSSDIEKQRIKKGSTFRVAEVSFLVIMTCIISLSAGMFLEYKLLDKKNIENETGQLLEPEIEEFVDNYNYIIDNYYDEIDKKELLGEAIKGMVDSLGDPHSVYMNEEEGESFNILLNGSYKGVGIQIADNMNGDIVVIKVFEGSPAEKVGLKPFDIITDIDDMSLEDKISTDLTDYIKGSEDDEFSLTYIRGDKQQTIDISKELISIKSVSTKIFEKEDNKIGYLKVGIFAANTYNQFKTQLEQLEKDNIDSLVIDLRDNSGGHLTTVKNMISLFLDTSHVIYQTQSRERIEKFYSSGTTTKQYPIVFLANNASASASEVMMGALRDEYGAVIVGESSFGKGTVQELQTISSGDQYKVTTKKWLTPSGYWVQDEGLEPDIEVKLGSKYFEDPNDETDNQLQSAIELLEKLSQLQ